MSAVLPQFPLFIAAAATVIATPGPGVVLTVTNAARLGVARSLYGILGIAVAGMLMAVASAAGVGLLLESSPRAFTALKLAGAAYLAWLGVKLWRREPPAASGAAAPVRARFSEALTLQFANPQAILFFAAVFPQFIEPAAPRLVQFTLLIASWGLMVVGIHAVYAALAARAAAFLASPGSRKTLDRVSGTAFIAFGASLAWAAY